MPECWKKSNVKNILLIKHIKQVVFDYILWCLSKFY